MVTASTAPTTPSRLWRSVRFARNERGLHARTAAPSREQGAVDVDGQWERGRREERLEIVGRREAGNHDRDDGRWPYPVKKPIVVDQSFIACLPEVVGECRREIVEESMTREIDLLFPPRSLLNV
jgi:hypothetical protein